MERYSRKDDGRPQLLDLIPKNREWIAKRSEETSHGASEEKKLELTLGPPRGEWTNTPGGREGLVSLSHFPPCLQNPILTSPSPWQHHHTRKLHSSYLHLPSGQGQVAVNKESSQHCSNNAAAEQSSAEKKAFSAAAANRAVHRSGSAQKRTAPASVVGWPPIRSYRKNIESTSCSKLASDSPDVAPSKVSTPKTITQNCSKSPFVKINMDGIPIGRKVDLKAYNSYEKLSLAVIELFRGLLAAQKDGCGDGTRGLLNGRGKYTLVYEDNEGDRMLVGDVPWLMFVATVKRLRVLKSSELPSLSGRSKLGKLSMNL